VPSNRTGWAFGLWESGADFIYSLSYLYHRQYWCSGALAARLLARSRNMTPEKMKTPRRRNNWKNVGGGYP
jgi:hypothetical protein